MTTSYMKIYTLNTWRKCVERMKKRTGNCNSQNWFYINLGQTIREEKKKKQNKSIDRDFFFRKGFVYAQKKPILWHIEARAWEEKPYWNCNIPQNYRSELHWHTSSAHTHKDTLPLYFNAGFHIQFVTIMILFYFLPNDFDLCYWREKKKRQITALTTKSIENHQFVINLWFLHSEWPFQMVLKLIISENWKKIWSSIWNSCMELVDSYDSFKMSLK